MKQKLPELTHLQFAVLMALEDGLATRGSAIRHWLKDVGQEQLLTSFYSLMKRMDGYVTKEPRMEIIGERALTEIWYTITKKGLEAMEQSRKFYERTEIE